MRNRGAISVTGARQRLRRVAIVGVATGAALVGMCAHRAVAQLPTTRVTLSPVGVAFGDQRLGTHAAFRVVTITNTTAAPVSLQGFTIGGADRTDFIGFTDCFPQGAPAVGVFMFIQRKEPAEHGPRGGIA